MAKLRNKESLQTPVSSLIDVVFQLIIFFIVTAAQDKDIMDETIRLAQAKNSPAVEKRDPRTVVINVRPNGQVNIQLIPLTSQQLQQILMASVAKYGNDIPVVVRSDGATLFNEIDRVLQTVGRAGLYRVRISAESIK
jgi:biopolymer transport protein ExbD